MKRKTMLAALARRSSLPSIQAAKTRPKHSSIHKIRPEQTLGVSGLCARRFGGTIGCMPSYFVGSYAADTEVEEARVRVGAGRSRIAEAVERSEERR
jgi:hypothetical protein